jgi:hypothetical protein
MPHPISDWLQSLRKWGVSGIAEGGPGGRVQVGLLVLPASGLQPMERAGTKNIWRLEPGLRSRVWHAGGGLGVEELRHDRSEHAFRAAETETGVRTVFGFVFCCVAVLVAGSDIRGRPLAEEQKSQSFCKASEYRQFDFWLGDWDAYESGSTTPEAHVKISRALDGCAIREQYESADGYEGESLSMYDKSRKVWQQSWFTNRGYMLVVEGTFHDGAMELTGSDRAPDRKERRVRGTWKPEDNGVRETAFRSTDEGKTWTQWFDLEFKSHKQ